MHICAGFYSGVIKGHNVLDLWAKERRSADFRTFISGYQNQFRCFTSSERLQAASFSEDVVGFKTWLFFVCVCLCVNVCVCVLWQLSKSE